MRKLVLTSLTAVALAGSAFAYNAFAAAGDATDSPRMHRMEDRGFMLDARLAGMKAALELSPEQEKLWTPFESAVRDAKKARHDAMRQMHEKIREDGPPSPIERMNEMSDRLAKASSELKIVADAAKPLFDGLDETQKRHFGPLLMTLREHHQRGGMQGGWGHHEGGDAQ
jgi:Spy/CpxP family protein refolding chaperone